jgi:hypothetical protein
LQFLDKDFIIRKNTSGIVFNYDAGTDELDLTPDELNLQDQWLSSAITLSESGETALDTTAQSIVGAINEIHPAAHRCEDLTFTDQGNPYVSENGTGWTNKGDFIFCGTTAGGTPSAMRITGWRLSGAASFNIRVYDFTNSQVICTSTGNVNTTKAIIDLGTLSNLPSGVAIFEVQVQASAVGSNWALSSVMIDY